jgi:hypothetical protein
MHWRQSYFIYIFKCSSYLYTPNLSRKSMCGDLLTCIPLFVESVFEVPLKKRKKKDQCKKRKKEARG